MDAAFADHPEGFVGGASLVVASPKTVWINPSEDRPKIEIGLH